MRWNRKLSATTSLRGFITITGGTLNVTGAATFNHGTDLEFNSGSLNIGGTLTIEDDAFAESAAPLIQLGGLSITGTSQINLESGKMIVANTALSTIQGYITSGYHSGAWNGNAISSTTAKNSGGKTALGYASAGSIGLSSFAGKMVNPTDTLIRYTYCGDANLDGKVNAEDFDALAANYGKSGRFWSQGDFNYDGVVNVADFNALAMNFNATPQGSAPALGTLVPEPATFALLFTLGMTGLVPRRTRPKSLAA